MGDRTEIGETMKGALEIIRSREAEIRRLESSLTEARAQRDLAIEAERKDCEKALLALAGRYPTPVEGYGYNTSWAISDLCRAVAEAHAESAAVLEKAAEIVESSFVSPSEHGPFYSQSAKQIRALIPLPAAAALAEYERREFTAGIKVATLSITNENIEHPALVDFRAALVEVKRKERLEEANDVSKNVLDN